ncbi:MAG: hypothetical protein JNL83_16260 [Myxococcales bacterium]|nr:hypothetical protein [Myxococcales bacterium]
MLLVLLGAFARIARADTPVERDEEADAEDEEAEKSGSKVRRNFAGSVQLDYMAIPTESEGRTLGLDGATAEASLKMAIDFNGKISANVKACIACHGFEVGMAYFDLRVADELNFRVGRFTPAFGEFPVRHDPANHRTSDKPLPYDMGRMLRINDFNEGVLPSPWVDNGLEINGTHFFGEHVQLDYAVYAIGGPKAGADPVDFDFKLSRSGESYYVDNNSRPVIGGQVVASVVMPSFTWSAGVSMMRGTYDPEHRLRFSMMGAHMVLRAKDVYLRLEYLSRRTKMSLGEDPMERFKYGPRADGTFDPWMVKDGGYAEIEVPVTSRLTLIGREDFLRRRGNVVKTSDLRSDSAILRHTAGVAVALWSALRLKLSYEYYDFSDFEDESVIHLGLVGPF